MKDPGTLIHCEEALDLIRSTSDPVVRNLLDVAFTAFIKGRYAGHRAGPQPDGDFDMLFCMNSLKTLFSDRDYLSGLISGGEPERWFDDDRRKSAGRGPALDASALTPSIPPADAATS